MANPDYDDEHDEEFMTLIYKVLFSDFFCDDQVKAYSGFRAATGHQIFRVIPRWKAIKDIPGVMPCEDMREIVRAYEGKLCNTRCICRTSSAAAKVQQHFRKCAVHEGTLPLEGHCNHLGYIAEYYAEVMGFTPYLTIEQMIESLEPLEKSRGYHMGPNRRDVNFICNCCECCHVAFPSGRRGPVNQRHWMWSSRPAGFCLLSATKSAADVLRARRSAPSMRSALSTARRASTQNDASAAERAS